MQRLVGLKPKLQETMARGDFRTVVLTPLFRAQDLPELLRAHNMLVRVLHCREGSPCAAARDAYLRVVMYKLYHMPVVLVHATLAPDLDDDDKIAKNESGALALAAQLRRCRIAPKAKRGGNSVGGAVASPVHAKASKQGTGSRSKSATGLVDKAKKNGGSSADGAVALAAPDKTTAKGEGSRSKSSTGVIKRINKSTGKADTAVDASANLAGATTVTRRSVDAVTTAATDDATPKKPNPKALVEEAPSSGVIEIVPKAEKAAPPADAPTSLFESCSTVSCVVCIADCSDVRNEHALYSFYLSI